MPLVRHVPLIQSTVILAKGIPADQVATNDGTPALAPVVKGENEEATRIGSVFALIVTARRFFRGQVPVQGFFQKEVARISGRRDLSKGVAWKGGYEDRQH